MVCHVGSIPRRPGLESMTGWGLLGLCGVSCWQSETDWEGWRTATRALVLAGAEPDDVQWSVRGA